MLWTKSGPALSLSWGQTGKAFPREGYQIIALDGGAARALNAKALATHRIPAELVAEMVRQQPAAASA
jgi:hypothetical protein